MKDCLKRETNRGFGRGFPHGNGRGYGRGFHSQAPSRKGSERQTGGRMVDTWQVLEEEVQTSLVGMGITT